MQKEKLNKRKIHIKQDRPPPQFPDRFPVQTDGILFLGLIQGSQQSELTPGSCTPFPLMWLKLLE